MEGIKERQPLAVPLWKDDRTKYGVNGFDCDRALTKMSLPLFMFTLFIKALRVLRPEKFGRAETQQSRKKRQASAPQPDSESPATLVGPPLEAASQNLQPSPAKLNSKEDAPNFASEETTPISPASESKTENDREGPIEGVVNKFQATFSAAE